MKNFQESYSFPPSPSLSLFPPLLPLALHAKASAKFRIEISGEDFKELLRQDAPREKRSVDFRHRLAILGETRSQICLAPFSIRRSVNCGARCRFASCFHEEFFIFSRQTGVALLETLCKLRPDVLSLVAISICNSLSLEMRKTFILISTEIHGALASRLQTPQEGAKQIKAKYFLSNQHFGSSKARDVQQICLKRVAFRLRFCVRFSFATGFSRRRDRIQLQMICSVFVS